jgi:hypothetical protein
MYVLILFISLVHLNFVYKILKYSTKVIFQMSTKIFSALIFNYYFRVWTDFPRLNYLDDSMVARELQKVQQSSK